MLSCWTIKHKVYVFCKPFISRLLWLIIITIQMNAYKRIFNIFRALPVESKENHAIRARAARMQHYASCRFSVRKHILSTEETALNALVPRRKY